MEKENLQKIYLDIVQLSRINTRNFLQFPVNYEGKTTTAHWKL